MLASVRTARGYSSLVKSNLVASVRTLWCGDGIAFVVKKSGFLHSRDSVSPGFGNYEGPKPGRHSITPRKVQKVLSSTVLMDHG